MSQYVRNGTYGIVDIMPMLTDFVREGKPSVGKKALSIYHGPWIDDRQTRAVEIVEIIQE